MTRDDADVRGAWRWAVSPSELAELVRAYWPIARVMVPSPLSRPWEDVDDDLRGPNEHEVARDVVRGAAMLLASARGEHQPLAIDTLVSLLDAMTSDNIHNERRDDEALHHALVLLCQHLDPASEVVARLVAKGSASARHELALALSTRTEKGREILFRLATDRDPEVRRVATKRLSGIERPWWHGAFASDPLARVSPADAALLVPIAAALTKHLGVLGLEGGRSQHLDLEGLWTTVKALPGAWAAEIVPRLLSQDVRADATLPLVAAMVEHEEGVAPFVRLVAAARGDVYWALDKVTPRLAKRWPALAGGLPGLVSPAARVRVCRAGLASWAKALDAEANHGWPEVIAAWWPSDEDPLPIIEVLLADEEAELRGYDLLEIVKRSAQPGGATLARLMEAYLAPEVCLARTVAERFVSVLERASPEALAAGLASCLGTHDPERAVPLVRGLVRQAPDALADWYQRLELMRGMMARLAADSVVGPLILPRLLLRLEAGVADPTEAQQTVALSARKQT